MLSKDWTQVEGFSNLDEANESIWARFNGEEVELGYMAFCGMKIVCLSGVSDFVSADTVGLDYSDIQNELGDDWEVAFYVKCNNINMLVAIDSNCDLVAIGEAYCDIPTITQAEEFDGTELDGVDADLLSMFGL